VRKHHVTYRWARRIAVGVVGGTVLLIGIALLVLPGPALVVIPIGLAILGAEFAWARHWLRRMREGTVNLINAINNDTKRE
jgi:tellurite resistance protein TerC